MSWILSLVRDTFYLQPCAGQGKGRNQCQNEGQVVLCVLFCMWPPANTQEIWIKEGFKRKIWGKIRSRIRSASFLRRNLECESELLPRCYNKKRLVMREFWKCDEDPARRKDWDKGRQIIFGWEVIGYY